MSSYTRKAAGEIFCLMGERTEGLEAREAYEVVGMVVGLFALALEREHGIDRNATFKMVQRVGHKTVSHMEDVIKEGEKNG